MLNLDKVPKNVFDAINMLEVALTLDERNYLLKTNDGLIYNGFRRDLINIWSLDDKETPLPKWFATNLGVNNEIIIFNLILEGMFAKMCNQKFDVKAHASKYL